MNACLYNMKTANHILIFKTNITTPEDRLQVAAVLDQQPFISKWTVDIEDIDRVLRIESAIAATAPIIHLIRSRNYECAELED